MPWQGRRSTSQAPKNPSREQPFSTIRQPPLGVYLRDLAQLIGPLVMITMFLGPVFYPREAMPAAAQPWLAINPITIPVEQARRVLFEAQWPQWEVLAQYSLVAVAVYLFGLWAFTKLKKGFADVL